MLRLRDFDESTVAQLKEHEIAGFKLKVLPKKKWNSLVKQKAKSNVGVTASEIRDEAGNIIATGRPEGTYGSEDLIVLGDVDFTASKKDEEVDKVLVDDTEVSIKHFDKDRKGFVGVLLLEDGRYIRIFDSKAAILLWPYLIGGGIIVVAVLMFALLPHGDKNFGDIDFGGDTTFDRPDIEDNTQDWDGQLPTSGEVQEASAESIAIPGYANLVLTADTYEVQLINPTGNTVLMEYDISEGGEILYETKALEPGKAVNVNLYDMLDAGDHMLSFKISTFDVDNYEPCNGATQEVKITIKK